MTVLLPAEDLVRHIGKAMPGSIAETLSDSIVIRPESLLETAKLLRDAPGLNFDYLNFITAVDYYQYFELVYRVTSLKHNHYAVFRVRTAGRDNQVVPSVTGVWQGADFQEREIFDLFGISFEGHPDLRRIFLWEGFEGYPLRKDFVS